MQVVNEKKTKRRRKKKRKRMTRKKDMNAIDLVHVHVHVLVPDLAVVINAINIPDNLHLLCKKKIVTPTLCGCTVPRQVTMCFCVSPAIQHSLCAPINFFMIFHASVMYSIIDF
jgi:hypothetical protein